MIDGEGAFLSICFVLFVSTLLIAFSFRKKKMGLDIYSGRGVIFTVDEFLKVINGKNKSNVVNACGLWVDKLNDQAKASGEEWHSDLAKRFNILSTLKKGMKISEIREVIASVVDVGGEVSKYGDCWVENSEYIEELFSNILDACPEADNVPPINQVVAWGSGRNNGWEVPKGVACVVFDSEYCFERALSEQGQAVQKVFGHCDETEWTEMSY
jgi:hypothetical protein